MARLTKPISDADHTRGSHNAPVKLVEYGDFQCPYCGAAFPVLQEIVQKMGDQLCFAFRNFPLSEMHEYALIAAEAAEAAAAQGKFWEMHNKIYTNQDQLDENHLYQWAEDLGLDMGQFDEDMRNHTYEDKVRQEFMGGVRSGVNGTPTLFINRERYDGPMEYNFLLEALNQSAETTQA